MTLKFLAILHCLYRRDALVFPTSQLEFHRKKLSRVFSLSYLYSAVLQSFSFCPSSLEELSAV